VDVSDGRVDDGRFGRTTDLRKIWKKGGQVKKTTVQSFTALTLDGIVSCSAFSGVCASARFAFLLRRWRKRSGRD